MQADHLCVDVHIGTGSELFWLCRRAKAMFAVLKLIEQKQIQ